MLVRPLRRRRAAPRGVDLGALLLALLVLLVLPAALAQAPADGDRLEGDDVVEGRIDGVPATFSVGLQGGLPGYRYASLVGAMRTDAFGVAARIGYGSVGVSGGVQLRFYPPLPLPIPTYVAAGLDVYTGNTAFHAALGAHVPVGQRVRLDLEGGVARASTLVGTVWAPYASFGVSYAFPLTLDGAAGEAAAAPTGTGSSVRCDAPPNASAIPAGVDDAVQAFVRDGVALYGSSFRGLTYRYRVGTTTVTGSTARVAVRYEGAATEVMSGNPVEASGTAQVDMRWNGCRWVATGVEY